MRALYERLEELETEQWQRGILDLTHRSPHAVGIRNPTSVLLDTNVEDGGITLHFADATGRKITAMLTIEQARELGFQDPEGYWRKKYIHAVVNGVGQRERDELYKEITGSKETSFWNSLERAFGENDAVERAAAAPIR